MPISRVLTISSLLAVLLSGLPSSAEDKEVTTLKGLPGGRVLVEGFTERAERAGFDGYVSAQLGHADVAVADRRD